MARSDAARAALLDAAERLFAESGIAQVSDRKVAESAGNTNHSAVRYYFGGREGLLQALITRHLVALEPPRRAMFAGSDSVLGDVRSLVVPFTDALGALPQPSSRARFLAQALHDPMAAGLLGRSTDLAPSASAITRSVVARLDHLDQDVVVGRARLMTRIVSTTCADVERLSDHEGAAPSWQAVGDFLADAIAGMLSAPVTHRPGVPLDVTDHPAALVL
ncbi:TetR family transcriptional regulator [Modestobacter sp. VKM Ac-2979]|uniref:TetR family transcriptional regulator n=1 Tax=unclassified Modestobacter TaxID=2643866 RepID=UPI0022ABC161|nr:MULTISPECIES: TetR family transcriptional regulator [unclassified Modestobacter]MCZ2811918.1 TetR family transcriptional regulator [Modestobacter sp. VKM Ac-2979]MCZ2843641.1 TetR family transcriptional regulator [Modestobacter sp. VKM Ac-2980]